MIGVHIPKMCTSFKSNSIRALFKKLNVGSVGPIIIQDSPNSAIFNNYGRSVDVFFRQYYDTPRSLEFKNSVMDPHKNFFLLYNTHFLEFKPIEDPNQLSTQLSTIKMS